MLLLTLSNYLNLLLVFVVDTDGHHIGGDITVVCCSVWDVVLAAAYSAAIVVVVVVVFKIATYCHVLLRCFHCCSKSIVIIIVLM